MLAGFGGFVVVHQKSRVVEEVVLVVFGMNKTITLLFVEHFDCSLHETPNLPSHTPKRFLTEDYPSTFSNHLKQNFYQSVFRRRRRKMSKENVKTNKSEQVNAPPKGINESEKRKGVLKERER